jgi:hypothetical protein
MQTCWFGMLEYRGLLQVSSKGFWRWYKVGHWKVDCQFPQLWCSGIEKAIFNKAAPVAWTQTLGSQKTWNKRCDNGMHMRQFCKVHSQFKQTVQVRATFKCTTLYIVLRVAWFQYFVHHLVLLHNILENGSVPILNVWVGCYSGGLHRYLCSITGHPSASPNQLGASLPFHLRMRRDSVLETLCSFCNVQTRIWKQNNTEGCTLYKSII